ncbi:lysylphosphatidylglycerol synthase transmembrane domain-containing protein [Porifericola rhodea]|uniref:lysylphosphatidylglycerol synthase transmembrane domain-containing protein n=1 Tax=Porifericola rhodea TaxID=930972 RepID=UPI00266647D1|nr:lysylphosphatidylglycerol synthase transmembrane domain-containing protein [Porifericola rhodea]WKN31863.1 lysylphosphatidylglycerol synthase transmembrane domain-containing protein [Porifericola rhodea]
MENQPAPQKPAYKRYLNLLLKIGLTSLALFLVFRKVDLQQVGTILRTADYLWLVPALFLFLLSKYFNALRLQEFFRYVGLHLDTTYNLKLYLVGMFYNLFLPGGIGGDGYKVLLLRKAKGVKTRDLITASLLDRISGVVALGVLMFFSVYFSNIYEYLEAWRWLIWAGILLAYPLYYILLRYFFKSFLPIFNSSNIYSILVQTIQLGSVIMILLALHVDTLFAEYSALFMLSTFAAMLPLTIGGIGAREAVFVYLPPLIGSSISEDTSVTLSLLFFLITVVSSLGGAFIKAEQPQFDKTEAEIS